MGRGGALGGRTCLRFFPFIPVHFGRRVDSQKDKGVFCKIANDGRPEALAALLVGKDILAKMLVRCTGYKINLRVHMVLSSGVYLSW